MSNSNELTIRARCGVCGGQLNINHVVKDGNGYRKEVISSDGFLSVFPCEHCTKHYHNVMGGVVDLVDRYRETVKLVQEEEGADE